MNSLNLPYRELKEFCRKYHIRKMSLFGSVLTEEFIPEKSDIDVLVEFIINKHPSLFQFAGIEIELSELINHKVDLKTKEDLSIYFRNDVLKSSKTIYENE